MLRIRSAGALIFTVFFCVALFAQTAQKQQPPTPAKEPAATAKPDYSQEPFLIELYRNSSRFENDGTGLRELEVRVRIQSEAGVRAFGQLAFGYNSANEKMEINFVEVRKPDGSVTPAPADAVQDMTTGVAREAPVYTDYRQKHVTVPALRPGDVLAYRVTTTISTPLAPGQFWVAHDFLKDAIVLSEQFEVNVPRDRAIKLKTLPGAEPAITDEGARRVYRWKSSSLKRESDEDEDSDTPKKKEKKPEFPAIQLTTFQNWAEVGVWYAGLERERAVATPAIRAKAEELVRDRKTEIEKIEGLYSFVAKNFRYVSLSFGVGRYQPHSAEEVLANQYGDCKDKHTLLEALIEAIGLHADPVLASASRKLDPDMPSPGQFDHVFTVIRTGSDEKSWIWLDTTTEVAPFRLLSASLRKKQVLLVPMRPPMGIETSAASMLIAPRLVETPADPPFPATQRVLVQGQVSELGKLTAKISYTLRGDTELILRSAFRRTPKPQWKDLARAIARSDGFNGDVSDVQASDPGATDEAFHIEIQIAEPNFFDWTSHNSQLNLPLPRTGLPNVREPESGSPQVEDPIDLGSPLEISTRVELEMPAAFKAQSPVPVSVSRDYAEYNSSYKVEGSKVTAERTLRFRMRELPSARTRDYLAFVRAVRSDEDQTLTVETASAAKPAIPTTAKPAELYEAARAALQNSNFAAAIELLNRVVALEPAHKSAWNDLGRVYAVQLEFTRAAEYFRKQIEVNPYDSEAYLLLGLVLGQERKYTEAEAALRKQIELNPLDRQAHAALGGIFLEEQKYAEAIPELEKGVTLAPQSPDLRVALGRAYLNTGKTEEAMAAFDKAVELSPTPPVWNNISYELAKKNVGLDRAQQYAESAVAAVAAGLRNLSLARLSLDDLQRVSGIAANWDTLGWVLFQRGDLSKAETYVRAAWLLSQHGEVGDHLGQIYEKQGRKKESLDLYAQAVAAPRPLPETKTKLLALVGDEKKLASMTSAAAFVLSSQRSIKLGNLKWEAGTKDTASAEFFLAFEPGASANAPPKVTDIKYISGDGALRPLSEALRTARFPDMFPDATPTQIVRRGILSCSRQTHDCVFVMILPENVHSVD